MKKLWATTAMLFAIALGSSSAQAVEMLTLTGPIDGDILGPQSASDPCIIAGTACHQPATIGFGNFAQGGSITSFNQWSDNSAPGANNGTTLPSNTQGVPYTVALLDSVVSSSFVVAIDVNTAMRQERLLSFEVLDTTTNTVIASFTGPALIGDVFQNGNGFGDFQLGTISLAGLPTTDGIAFNAQWDNNSDGAESFYLVNATSAVPEPSTWAMMLLGFVGLAFAFRSRRKITSFA